MSVAGVVQVTPRGGGDHRGMAAPLQRGQTAQQPGLLDAPRVQAAVSVPSTTRRLPGMFGVKKPSRSGGVQPDLIKIRPMVLREPLVAYRPVEAFHVGVLLGLARFDVLETNAP